MLDYTNQGVDALKVRLYKNGRLRPEMIPDYTWSLMKRTVLLTDSLFGSEKRGEPCVQTAISDLLLSIFQCAKESYDLIILICTAGSMEPTAEDFWKPRI